MVELPHSITTLFHSINDEVFQKEIVDAILDEQLSEMQFSTIMTLLVQTWSQTLNESKTNRTNFKHGSLPALSTQSIVNIVERMNVADIFCQILLLIPEDAKTNLLIDLCQHIKDHQSSSKPLYKSLLCQTCTAFARNFMYNIHETNENTRKQFYKNILEILKVLHIISQEEASNNMFYLLHNVLFSHLKPLQLGVNKNKSPILNKVDFNQVKELQKFCKNLLLEKAPPKKYGLDMELSYLDEHFNRFLLNLIQFLQSLLPTITVGLLAQDSEDMITYVIVRLKQTVQKMKEKSIYGVDEALTNGFIKTCTDTFSNYDMLAFISCSTSSHDVQEIGKAYLNAANSCNLSKCIEEENAGQKFMMALKILNQLYQGNDEMINILLDYDHLDKEHCTDFVRSLSTYLINFGSLELIRRIIDKCVAEKNQISLKTDSLHKVLMLVLPHISKNQSNDLIVALKDVYSTSDRFIWLQSDKIREYDRLLTEVINKTTEDINSKEMLFANLSTLIIASPGSVLLEIIKRILKGNLKETILIKVLTHLPSLLDLKLTWLIGVDPYNSLILLLKKSYISVIDSDKAFTMLNGIVPDLLKNFLQYQKEFIDAIVTLLIVPSLHDNDNKELVAVLQKQKALTLLTRCLDSTGINCWSITLLLCLLKRVSDTKSFFEDEIDLQTVHRCMEGLVNILTELFPDLTLAVQTKTLKELEWIKYIPWNDALYFYSFFTSINYKRKYCIPCSLLEMCGMEDDPRWVPIDDLYDDGEDSSKWMALFLMSIPAMDIAESFIVSMEQVDIEDELHDIIEATSQVVLVQPNPLEEIRLSPRANVLTGRKVISCIKKLVHHQKIKSISTYLCDELLTAIPYHDVCFAMFILIHAFEMAFGITDNDPVCEHENIACGITILHSFVNFSKDIIDLKTRSYYLMYFLEQVVHVSFSLDDIINKHFVFLALDILKISMDLKESVDVETSSWLQRKHEQLFKVFIDNDFCRLLKEKYSSQITK